MKEAFSLLTKTGLFGRTEGAIECFAIPSGFGYTWPIYRGFTPACSLIRPSALRVGNFNSLINKLIKNIEILFCIIEI